MGAPARKNMKSFFGADLPRPCRSPTLLPFLAAKSRDKRGLASLCRGRRDSEGFLDLKPEMSRYHAKDLVGRASVSMISVAVG